MVRGRKGNYETLLTDLATQGFARARIDGELHELTDKVDLARYEQHTIEVIVDRLVQRDGIERRLTDSLETALRLAEGVAEVQHRARDEGDGRERGDAHVQPAPRLPDVRQELRRAGAPQLLVQLALRRVRALRRPRHPVRGRPRAGRPQPRPVGRRGRHRAVGRRARRSTSTGCSRRCARTNGIPIDKPWAKLTKKQQKMLLYGIGDGSRCTVRYKNRYGRSPQYNATLRGRHPVARSAATPRPTATASASRSRATCARCRAATCDGARLKPLSLAVTIDGRNIAEICDLPIGEAAEVLAGARADRARPPDRRAGGQGDQRPHAGSCSTSGSTTCRSAARRPRWPAARPSASGWRRRSAAAWSACCTCSTSRRSGCTSGTTAGCIETLERLRDLGNTVLVVEHDEDTIRVADHVVDIGPGAGRARRRGRLLRPGQGAAALAGVDHRAVPLGQEDDPGARAAPQARRAVARHQGRPGAQPQEHRRRDPARVLRVRDRRVGLGQVDAGQRHPLPGR